MPKITAGNNTFSFCPDEKKNLLQLLMEQGLLVDHPCSGKGTCGKCKIRLLEGIILPPGETERKLLRAEEIQSGIRLACMVVPENDLRLELLQKERKHEILDTGYMPEFPHDPVIQKKQIQIRKTDLDHPVSFEQQMLEQTGADQVEFEILTGDCLEPGLYTAVVYRFKNQKKILKLEKGDTSSYLYGAAIDIGTTTVVVSLVQIQEGKEIASASRINAQKHFGLDVLTRITYEMEHPQDGKGALQKVIVDSINEMLEELCVRSGIHRQDIYEIAVSANCTMMHMLLGVDARSIGKSPYTPVFIQAKNIPAESVGIQAAKGARLYCLPAVSSYIGADIVAGAYVCQLHRTKDKILFIDIGTNGEIILSIRGRMLCCSCAAGPALEGMNISCGMRAAEGAIEDVEITEKGARLKVIGGEKEHPVGICGSGILAAVKELVRTGLVKKDGAFIRKEKLSQEDYRYSLIQLNGKKREFVLTEKSEKMEALRITQGDVRQVQLAKGAILSGFYALLEKAGVSMEELDQVMIAGQFGAHLPADSLTGTGILPKKVENKLVYVGNSSKTGALMSLLSCQVRKEMEELAERMDYMELGNVKDYERLFTNCMLFL